MHTGISNIVKSGNGNALLITALGAAMVANALPTPADSFYFDMQQKIKARLEAGEITPEQYWRKDILNYYTYTAAWYGLLLVGMLAVGGSFKNNARALIVLASAGLVYGTYKKNIQKDKLIAQLKNNNAGN